MPKAKKPKYKIGQPVVVWDLWTDEEEKGQVPILGCIVDIDTDCKFQIDYTKYFVMWSDGEEDWYTETDIKVYVKQAKTGKKEGDNKIY